MALSPKASSWPSQPMWGCGLLGPIPGIAEGGNASVGARRLIDGLKVTSKFDKVSYWNWNYAPAANDDGTFQHLTEDFVFMPENWGVGQVDAGALAPAGSVAGGTPATIADIFLGANEPDSRVTPPHCHPAMTSLSIYLNI